MGARAQKLAQLFLDRLLELFVHGVDFFRNLDSVLIELFQQRRVGQSQDFYRENAGVFLDIWDCLCLVEFCISKG